MHCGTLRRSLRGWSLHARAATNFWKLAAKSQVRLTT